MSTAPVVLPRRGRPAKLQPIEVFAGPNDISQSIEKREGSGLSFSDFLHMSTNRIHARYRTELTKTEALEELAKLRVICQVAAEEINQRLIPDEEECLSCGRILPHGTKVTQMVNVKDPATGTSQTRVLCSIECVRQNNRVKMGLAELVK